jgi:formate--tetrahydrofolate ligase
MLKTTQPLDTLAASLGLSTADWEPVGWNKAKLAPQLMERLASQQSANYINVTAINPTPLGEGKTVTAIGLAMGLNRLGRRTIVTLRQPSQGPLFGIKGGGAGGGKATLFPEDEINLHFTGDLHAVASANNLLAALVDNHVARRRAPLLETASITWRRCLDVCDRSLRTVRTGLHEEENWLSADTGFDLTAASEIMSLLALATNEQDLRKRLGSIIVGATPQGEPVSVDSLRATGALTLLLKDAIRPNLVQTCEGTPALVHTGPFANISHGNSSVIADQIAVRLADYVVTENGFGADCGAEKFFNLKCRVSGLTPHASVLVCTIRALKFQSGRFTVKPGQSLPQELTRENLALLREGLPNLQAHLEILHRFGVPVVVAINQFPDDTPSELEAVRAAAIEFGAAGAALIRAFTEGGEGSLDLAQALERAIAQTANSPSRFKFLYPSDMPIVEKLYTIATQIYGADGVDLEPLAAQNLERFTRWGYASLPICIAKTQYSLSHDPQKLGRPRGFRLPIRDLRLAAGAGFLYALAGEIKTMPGLPKEPAALRM